MNDPDSPSFATFRLFDFSTACAPSTFLSAILSLYRFHPQSVPSLAMRRRVAHVWIVPGGAYQRRK
ncbi:hypothetical protein AAT19DRAFT_14386 [Rhodotorula toruloides]|uniref:Uncharacterized protein n=1 Tax=Rhodotorula toruloides TaxID=5286 RepID=A0A2T0ABJ1_RHOTO|nr:hypothetical protein AAT19DRAFT_14386 [Rhodotorula toruloides]